MGVGVTIRDVPETVRNELASRAARAGMSMQEYLLAMLVDRASRPAVDDVMAGARARLKTTDSRADVASILSARDADRR